MPLISESLSARHFVAPCGYESSLSVVAILLFSQYLAHFFSFFANERADPLDLTREGARVGPRPAKPSTWEGDPLLSPAIPFLGNVTLVSMRPISGPLAPLLAENTRLRAQPPPRMLSCLGGLFLSSLFPGTMLSLAESAALVIGTLVHFCPSSQPWLKHPCRATRIVLSAREPKFAFRTAGRRSVVSGTPKQS